MSMREKIAMRVASQRRKKMAQGGMVEEEEMNPSLAENMANSESLPDEGISNPEEMEEAQMMAHALMKKRDMYAMGGLVQSEKTPPLGNKPDEDMRSASEEPMSSEPQKPAEVDSPMISEEAMDALMRKKKSRKYMS